MYFQHISIWSIVCKWGARQIEHQRQDSYDDKCRASRDPKTHWVQLPAKPEYHSWSSPDRSTSKLQYVWYSLKVSVQLSVVVYSTVRIYYCQPLLHLHFESNISFLITWIHYFGSYTRGRHKHVPMARSSK